MSITYFIFSLNLFAESKTLTLGGKIGWQELAKTHGVTLGKGKFGYDSIELAKNSLKLTESTDLLLNFDEKTMNDIAGNYSVVSSDFVLTNKAIIGKGAALSRGTGKGMILRGNEDSIFGAGGRIGSFSIEFWIAPSIAENGERFFSWRSSRNIDNYSMYQTITATFSNNHLEWNFSNIFEGYTKNSGTVILSGTSTIIPDDWSFHKIIYNEENGLLEYCVNGQTESLQYLTSTGHESGDIYQMVLGVPADITLCPQYTGRIDDFRICEHKLETTFENSKKYDLYDISGGRFETNPIKVQTGSVLNFLTAIIDKPLQTDVRLYVRSGDNYFNWTNDFPKWLSVENNEKINPTSLSHGQYFQVACELFPDGDGKTTPSVTQIELHYTEISPPLPPFSIKATPGDSCVTIEWDYSADDSAGGYYVYYGERPGEYLGRFALEGNSPINVGNKTNICLTGLKNGSIYYFAVSTWSRFNSKINGTLSKEVFARPRKNKE